jgi:hypothetical protein
VALTIERAWLALKFAILMPLTPPETCYVIPKPESQTTLKAGKPGFYWTRSTNKQYPEISISEWNGDRWHHSGVSATSEPHEIEVLSPRLIPPSPYDGCHSGQDPRGA